MSLFMVAGKICPHRIKRCVHFLRECILRPSMTPFFAPTSKGVAEGSGKPQLIISLTTYPARIGTVHWTLHTLLRQNKKPDRILLWLAKDQFPQGMAELPKEILRLQKYGLEIKWCEDIKSYKKLVPALRECPDDILVTADDDILYPRNWLGKLWVSYESNSECIHAHRVRRISVKKDGTFDPYRSWGLNDCIHTERYTNFLTTGGGVLFPPHSLHLDVLDAKRFMSLSPTADDIWFWSMAVLRGTRIREASSEFRSCIINPLCGTLDSLYATNVLDGMNDRQIANIAKVYPQLVERCKSECHD